MLATKIFQSLSQCSVHIVLFTWMVLRLTACCWLETLNMNELVLRLISVRIAKNVLW